MGSQTGWLFPSGKLKITVTSASLIPTCFYSVRREQLPLASLPRSPGPELSRSWAHAARRMPSGFVREMRQRPVSSIVGRLAFRGYGVEVVEAD